MDTDTRRLDWKELLAAAGVVLSLLFVGIEIRQNTSAAKGQTRTELAALNQEWLLTLSDPQVMGPFTRHWQANDREGLDDTQIAVVQVLMIANLRRLENVYFQYQQSLVDETALDSYGFQVEGPLFTGEAFADWWFARDNRRLFDPGFVRLFERRIGIAPSAASIPEPLR